MTTVYQPSADGRTIRKDCTICHEIIAQGPGTEASTVAAGGLEFRHPVDVGGAEKLMSCSDCHHGTVP